MEMNITAFLQLKLLKIYSGTNNFFIHLCFCLSFSYIPLHYSV